MIECKRFKENIMNSATHRAKTWQIALFAANNTSTNLYLMFLNFAAYFLTGYVGVGVVFATTLLMSMRIWDAITDPLIGFMLDKTNGRFGKNRPFILIGNLILILTTFLMFFVSTSVSESLRIYFFIFVYIIYIIGYTCQTVVTKSAQSCLTNDPKQRPLFGLYDGIYTIILFSGFPLLVSNYLIPIHGSFNQEFFKHLWFIVIPLSLFLAILAIIALMEKDRLEYFGVGKEVKIKFKDYWEVLKSNRALQMLIVSASSDKLGGLIKGNPTITLIIYGIVCGNYALQGGVSLYVTIPQVIILFFGIKVWAQRLGQRKALLYGSIGGIVCNLLLMASFYILDPTTFALPGIEGFNGFTLFTIIFLTLWILNAGFSQLAGSMVITMTADCADYEVYRSGRYVPGLMGTLFSFVDKIISSFQTTIVGLLCAMIGFSQALPTVDTPYSESLKLVGLTCLCIFPIIGFVCNLIAMKFYPLTREKMVEIQAEIAKIKEKTLMEANNE